MSLIVQADGFYRASVQISPERYVVADTRSSVFSDALTRLARELGEDASEPPWDQVMAAGRAARWRSATEPVPFGSPSSAAAKPFTELLALSSRLRGSIESYRQNLLGELVETAEGVLQSGNEKLAEAVLDCLHDGERGETCLVTVGRRAAAAVAGWFEEIGEGYPVLVPRPFMAGRVWDLAIITGAGAWFPPQMLTTPRAAQTTLVHQSWIRDFVQFNGVFGEPATVGIRVSVREPRPRAGSRNLVAEVEAPELVPKPDWRAVAASIPRASEDDDLVDAKLAVLSGGYGVLLPISGDRIRGLHPDAPPGERVVSLKLTAVVPGSILLLRERGTEAALLRTLAASHLGADRQRIQDLQADWKGRLREAIGREGAGNVARALRARDAQTVNLAYWSSDDCLRPQRDADFAVLLKYLGIRDPAPFIAAGIALWRAHSKAGHDLTRALEQRVEQLDLAPLEIHGLQELHPEGAPSAATMTAFRVAAVSAETIRVPRHSTRRPFHARGAAWLE
ncbi:MAG TPA: hypothetical protein VLW50_25885 [Streptosporangiaceae bacterium]|nr:hypothetical protein [Streptosporangiaceae bacterium]